MNGFFLIIVLLLTPTLAKAQESETEPETETETETETDTEYLEDGATLEVESSTRPIREPTVPDILVPPSALALSYWGRGEPRFFIGGALDLGFLFLRPRFQFGYGRPHWSWLGLEVNPLVSTSLLGAYAGARVDFPFIELRVGGRYVFTFQQSFLTPRQSYDQLALESREGPPSRYLSLEAQIELKLPLGPGDFRSEITGTYVTLVDQAYYVYEGVLRVVTSAPWIWGVEAGYRISFGPMNAVFVQPAAELTHLVGRDEVVVRAGLRAGVQLWPDLQIQLVVMPTVYGPDRLGDQGSDMFLIGIRYLFATDSPNFKEEDADSDAAAAADADAAADSAADAD